MDSVGVSHAKTVRPDSVTPMLLKAYKTDVALVH